MASVFSEKALENYPDAPVEISERWFNGAGKGLQFYKITGDMDKKILGDQAYNNFGKSLMEGDRINIALLRIVGASERTGVTIKTNDLIGYEELRQYSEKLSYWAKGFYRDFIKKSKITATISLEM